jgi:hypothetical protein
MIAEMQLYQHSLGKQTLGKSTAGVDNHSPRSADMTCARADSSS